MEERWTRTDYARLPEGFPAQLIEGELVKEPSPTFGHQWILSELHLQLARLVGSGRVIPAPMDVELDDYNVYQPDLIVVEAPRPYESPNAGIPLIAVEIVSPSSALRDRAVKRGRLLAGGVREVWIIDAARGELERHDANGSQVACGPQTLVSAVVPELELRADTFFARFR